MLPYISSTQTSIILIVFNSNNSTHETTISLSKNGYSVAQKSWAIFETHWQAMTREQLINFPTKSVAKNNILCNLWSGMLSLIDLGTTIARLPWIINYGRMARTMLAWNTVRCKSYLRSAFKFNSFWYYPNSSIKLKGPRLLQPELRKLFTTNSTNKIKIIDQKNVEMPLIISNTQWQPVPYGIML